MSGARELDRLPRWRVWLPLIALLPLAALVQRLASGYPELVEHAYSRGAYPVIARAVMFLTGWFPLSLAELLVGALLLLIARNVVLTIIRVARRQRGLWNGVLHGSMNALALAGLIYAMGIFLWGLNYQRIPLADSAGLDRSVASVEELRALGRELTAETNALREQVGEDANGVMRLHSGRREALARTRLGFERLRNEYSVLDGSFVGRPKGVWFSTLMSWFGPNGIYIAHTAEPNVNLRLPHTRLASTACHEMAHQMGFAREDEASFVGYLAARRHPDVDFRYAGTLRALSYVLHALARADPDSYRAILNSCSESVERDRAAERAFSRRHEWAWSKATRRINDAYLKSQGQTAGVRSYGQVVDLLIADRRQR